MLSSKLQLLKGLAAASFVFSFCLLISTFVACGVCYTEPCYEGDGVATLWSVNRALGFQAVTDAFVSCAWVAGVLWFLLRSRDEGKLTLLLGSGGLVVLLSLQPAALFGECDAHGKCGDAAARAALDIEPLTGRFALFDSGLVHEVRPVRSARRCALTLWVHSRHSPQ